MKWLHHSARGLPFSASGVVFPHQADSVRRCCEVMSIGTIEKFRGLNGVVGEVVGGQGIVYPETAEVGIMEGGCGDVRA